MTELINKYKASIKDLEGQYKRTREFEQKLALNQMIDDQLAFVADMERFEKLLNDKK